MVLRFFLFAVSFFFMFCSSIESDNPYDPDGVSYIGDKFSYGTVIYEGYTYPTIVIGTQTWMVKNLNYNASGSKCYNNKKSNCAIYGRLYDWATAMDLPPSCNFTSCASRISANHRGICPEGWHIPRDEEFDTLIEFAGGESIAGRYLKALTGWSGNGEDKYGFAALQNADSSDDSYWWTVTEKDPDVALLMGINSDLDIEDVACFDCYSHKFNSTSVRCLQDEP